MSDLEVNVSGLTALDYVNTILYNFPGGAQIATWNAAKRAGSAGKMEGSFYASRIYNISRSNIRKNSNVIVKQEGGGSGTTKIQIIYSGQLIDLLQFKPRVSNDGVRYSVKKGELQHLRHAFDVPAYGNRIFERVGIPRHPIYQILGPSVPHMMNDQAVGGPMSDRIMQVFMERLKREIGHYLSTKAGG